MQLGWGETALKSPSTSQALVRLGLAVQAAARLGVVCTVCLSKLLLGDGL